MQLLRAIRAICVVTLALCAAALPPMSAPAFGGRASNPAAPVATQAQSAPRANAPRRRPAPAQRRRRSTPRPQRRPDVIFVPTPMETVAEMLRLANIREGDVLYDLGSGDGRIPIMAAQRYGIRAVGIEIDPALVAQANEQAQREGVANLVSFRQADLFQTDLREATVVTLYLSDSLNLRLHPKLLRELRPGARIVSHDFRMGDWPPEQTVRVPWENLYRTVYVWTVPARGRSRR